MIDEASSIILLMHWNPDGDALGSGLGLALALREMGKDAHIVSSQEMPKIYEFLEPQRVVEGSSPWTNPDLVILLDCDRPERAGDMEPLASAAQKTLVIDHHPATSDFGSFRLTDVSAAATAEVIFHLLKFRKAPLTYSIAEALLTGLVTDTGGFRFRNTRAQTLEAAADLTRVGPSVAEIVEAVYDTRSMSSLKLMARALESLQQSPRGSVAWATLSHNDFIETHAIPEDTEGFVNLIHTLKGAQIAAILREEQPGRVRVSFRSKGEAVVNGAAEALGGGGHARASACILETSLQEAEERVLEELKKWTEF
ncbi:MAG: bifunctional oligoribonuclease/PAP phosphatase NrnA [Armatimonadetes bacterium]|nr:bifunctional oligoribonuclease/PAP phosphatase NrnA [Armatimonadota bacterium]